MGKFLDHLTLLFIALKLTGYIDWSWFFVLLPMIASGTAGFLVAFSASYKKARQRRAWRRLKDAHEQKKPE